MLSMFIAFYFLKVGNSRCKFLATFTIVFRRLSCWLGFFSLCFMLYAMLMGRLEFLSVLVLFMPVFWQR